MLRAKCVSERMTKKGLIKVEKYYLLDWDTIFLDVDDGSTYCEVYEDDEKRTFVARLDTKHFKFDEPICTMNNCLACDMNMLCN